MYSVCMWLGVCGGGGRGEGEVGGGSTCTCMCSTCTEGVSLHVSVSVCGGMGGSMLAYGPLVEELSVMLAKLFKKRRDQCHKQ